jgi:hypothetical protein
LLGRPDTDVRLGWELQIGLIVGCFSHRHYSNDDWLRLPDGHRESDRPADAESHERYGDQGISGSGLVP